MGQISIKWCDRVWNPIHGCDRVSPGCDHCEKAGGRELDGRTWDQYPTHGGART